jgi:putative transposase
MTKSRFSDAQKATLLTQAEADALVQKLCRKHGITSAELYTRLKKFHEMGACIASPAQQVNAYNREPKKGAARS